MSTICHSCSAAGDHMLNNEAKSIVQISLHSAPSSVVNTLTMLKCIKTGIGQPIRAEGATPTLNDIDVSLLSFRWGERLVQACPSKTRYKLFRNADRRMEPAVGLKKSGSEILHVSQQLSSDQRSECSG